MILIMIRERFIIIKTNSFKKYEDYYETNTDSTDCIMHSHK